MTISLSSSSYCQNRFLLPPLLNSPSKRRRCHTLLLPLILFGVLLFTGCSYLLAPVTESMSQNLSNAVLNNDDPATVEAGAPAYLLLMDGLLEGNPDNESVLKASATLNSAYAGVFVRDPERQKRLTTKALKYAFRALCLRNEETCEIRKKPFEEFEATLKALDEDDISALYTLGSTWASWIQADSGNWDAIAEVAHVKAIMEHVLALDEQYERGGVHLYLGVLATLLPPSLGGKPEVGRQHFERAVELSGGRNLMAKVMFAKQYARLIFERELHDQLLNEVIAADPKEYRLTLINTLAQKQAKELLATGDDYF